MIEGAAARLHAQQLGVVGAQRHRLVALLGGEGGDAHVVQQGIEAVGLHHVAGEVGIDVLGVVAGFQDQRLTVHVADTGEAVDRRALPQLHLVADDGRRCGDLKIHQRAAGLLAHGGYLGGEGVAHAPAVGGGVGHEGAPAALANHKALLLQLADGLTDGVAADVQRAAQLGLAGQQIAHGQHSGGDVALDDAHQLGIERNVAVQRQRCVEKCVAFHGGCFLSCAPTALVPIVPYIP